MAKCLWTAAPIAAVLSLSEDGLPSSSDEELDDDDDEEDEEEEEEEDDEEELSLSLLLSRWGFFSLPFFLGLGALSLLFSASASLLFSASILSILIPLSASLVSLVFSSLESLVCLFFSSLESLCGLSEEVCMSLDLGASLSSFLRCCDLSLSISLLADSRCFSGKAGESCLAFLLPSHSSPLCLVREAAGGEGEGDELESCRTL